MYAHRCRKDFGLPHRCASLNTSTFFHTPANVSPDYVCACRRTAAQLGRQLLGHHARYQAVAKAATSTAAQGMLSQWQRQAALAAAQRGLTSATLRYSAVRGALSFIGPMMWAWLAFDLVRAAVGTDYARVVRAVYIMAQVRLVATQGWSNPEDDDAAGSAASGAGYGFGSSDAEDDVYFS
jgi:hypothetical protein